MPSALAADVLLAGMPPFRCSFALPRVLPEFRRQYPQVQFHILEAPSAELDRKLLEGEIDLAFYMCFSRSDALNYRTLNRDRMYVLIAKGHPLEEKALAEGSFAWEWLEGQTLLLQNRTQRQGQYILQELQNRGLKAQEVLESSNIRAAAARGTAAEPASGHGFQRCPSAGLHPAAGISGGVARRELSAQVYAGLY